MATTAGSMSGGVAQDARMRPMPKLIDVIASAVPRRTGLCENCKKEMLLPLSWRNVCLLCMREETKESQRAAVAKAEKEHK